MIGTYSSKMVRMNTTNFWCDKNPTNMKNVSVCIRQLGTGIARIFSSATVTTFSVNAMENVPTFAWQWFHFISFHFGTRLIKTIKAMRYHFCVTIVKWESSIQYTSYAALNGMHCPNGLPPFSNELKRCSIFRKLDILTYQKEPKYLRFIAKRTIPSCLLLFPFVLMLSYIWLTHMCAAVQMKCTATNQNRCKHVLSTTFQHIVRANMCVRARLLRFGYNLPYYLRFFHSKLVWMCRFCCKADSSINYCCYSHFRSFFILFSLNDRNIQNFTVLSIIQNYFYGTPKIKGMSSSSGVSFLLRTLQCYLDRTSGYKIKTIACNSLPLWMHAIYREFSTKKWKTLWNS